MILSVAELKEYITTTETDAVLEEKLRALEILIRRYTNNNFQDRGYRAKADIVGNLFLVKPSALFNIGDTVEVTESVFNAGLYTVAEVTDAGFEVADETTEESCVLVTRVRYPVDVRMGVVNMLKWDLENRDKVGVQSETISRHSVTYFNMDGDNAIMGYPKSLLGFLKPYKKARF